MEHQLKILVQRPDKSKPGYFKDIFRNTITYKDGMDFNQIISAFKVVFPYPDIIISFSLFV